MQQLQPHFLWTQPVPLFAGKDKHKGKHHRSSKRSDTAFERELIKAGIDRQLLKTQWGVTLWRIKEKDGNRIKLRVEADRPLDEAAFKAWLVERLGYEPELSIQQRPVASCCGKGCRGCLAVDKDKRKTWIG